MAALHPTELGTPLQGGRPEAPAFSEGHRSGSARHPKKPDYVLSSRRMKRLGAFLRKLNLYFALIKNTSPRCPHGAAEGEESAGLTRLTHLEALAPQQTELERAILYAHGVDDLEGLLQRGLDLLAMQPPDPALGLVARVMADARLLCAQRQSVCHTNDSDSLVR